MMQLVMLMLVALIRDMTQRSARVYLTLLRRNEFTSGCKTLLIKSGTIHGGCRRTIEIANIYLY